MKQTKHIIVYNYNKDCIKLQIKLKLKIHALVLKVVLKTIIELCCFIKVLLIKKIKCEYQQDDLKKVFSKIKLGNM